MFTEQPPDIGPLSAINDTSAAEDEWLRPDCKNQVCTPLDTPPLTRSRRCAATGRPELDLPIDPATADALMDAAADAVRSKPESLCALLDELPAAVYVTDTQGVITYCNRACATFAGRRPEIGTDRWCVSWKIYTLEGELLPHDQCPMAVAIQEKRAIRRAEAVAERPDGTRIHFVPFPTPIFDEEGNLIGAVNLLLDVTDQRGAVYLHEEAARCRRLADAVTDRHAVETLSLMAAKYEEHALKLGRPD